MSALTLRIRQTHARTFERCKRKYKLSAIDKLVLKEKKPALSIGTACHAGRAQYLRTWSAADAIDAALASIDAEILTYPSLGAIEHGLNKNGSSKANCDCIRCMKLTITELLASYCSTFEQRISRSDFVVHAVEQKIETKIAEYQDLEMWFEGTCDADVTYGKYRMNFEFKTTTHKLEQFIDREYLSIQHTGYPFALHKEKQVPFYGTILDVSRKATKENPPEHAIEIIQKSEDDYAEFHRDMVERLRQIAYAMDNDYWPPNFDSCFGIYGRCEYYDICRSRFSPAVLRSKYAVVDDNAQVVADVEAEPNG